MTIDEQTERYEIVLPSSKKKAFLVVPANMTTDDFQRIIKALKAGRKYRKDKDKEAGR